MEKMNGIKTAQFTLSLPGSEASSRASSPDLPEHTRNVANHAPARTTYNHNDLTTKYIDNIVPGRQGRDVYDTNLSWWRAGVRRKLVEMVQWESVVIAKMQDKIRSPWLDAYFVYSSTLGTHTFFMTILPALFFFGYGETGRGLLTILGIGIYVTSVFKDLFCSPRPYAPPVTRLTIGTHHLEYGFPSTHATNSISIALFFFAEIHRLASVPISLTILPDFNSTTFTPEEVLSPATKPLISYSVYILLCAALVIYAFSVVFGRLYTAMHSFTDCVMGVLVGAATWWWHTSWAGVPVSINSSSVFYQLFRYFGFGSLHPSGELLVYLGKGLGTGKWIEGWIQHGGWEIPLILIPLCLFAVHVHPQPVDDCPCFEDSIAVLSAMLGALVSRWALTFTASGYPGVIVMPGSGWALEAGKWTQHARGLDDVLTWWAVAVLKMSCGILAIFAWRLFAKSTLHLALPPTFRLLARAVQLPHRRFYTPATQYTSVPSEFAAGGHGAFGLHSIPSVIDLPGSAGVSVEVGGIGSGTRGVSHGRADLKNRAGAGARGEKGAGGPAAQDRERAGKDGPVSGVKHYDADVLTKVIVYSGIGVLATEVIPLAFEFLGWGVRSWVPAAN